MQSGSYKIGEVASKLATSVRAIRYYEEEGLLSPIRTERGTRLYSEKHIRRLAAILQLTRLGFSIASIRHIALLRADSHTGDESSTLVSASLYDVQVQISDKIRELENLSVEISRSMEIVKKCKGCNNHPDTAGCPNCPVIDQRDNIQLLNLVWDTE